MSHTSTLILLGVLIILTPFSGLPIAIRTLLAVIFGASVSGIALALRAHEARSEQRSQEAPPPPDAPASAPEPTPPSPISPI